MFEICIDKVISNQLSCISNAYSIIVFQKHHFKKIIKFLKNILMTENGEAINSLLLASCKTQDSQMNLKIFN